MIKTMVSIVVLLALITFSYGCGDFLNTVVGMENPPNPLVGTWQVDTDTGEVTITPTLSDSLASIDPLVGVWEWITSGGRSVHEIMGASQDDTINLIWTFFAGGTWELAFYRNDQLVATEFGTYTLDDIEYTMISQSSEFILDKGDLFIGTYRKEGDRLILTERSGGDLVLVNQQ